MIDDFAKSDGEIPGSHVNEALFAVKEEVSGALSASPAIISQYTKHLASSQGKYIRALSILVCALNSDGLLHADAVKIASAVELLHLATLVHDDVIDDADIRRGKPTLRQKYGNRTAVICGDWLFCMALQKAASISDRKYFEGIDLLDYVVRICSGELIQQINNGNYSLSAFQYLKIISGKTAALFEASFIAGACLSGCEQSEIRLYRKMGKYLGMIFQLIDDCMDFETTVNVAGKPVQSDFEQNVITLPVIYTFRNLEGLKERAQSRDIPAKELGDAVRNSDGTGYTRSVAGKYYDKYVGIMNKLDVSKQKRDSLLYILDKAYRVF